MAITLSTIIIYILIKQEEKSKNAPSHPYFCPNCFYETIGTIAAGGNSCPECGCQLTYNNADRLVSRTWIATGKICKKDWKIYYIYQSSNYINNEYIYKRTIISESDDGALVLAKNWYGNNAIAIKSDNFIKDQYGNSFLPQCLIKFKIPDVAVYSDKNGNYNWADGSDGKLNPEQIIKNHINKNLLG